MGIRIKLSLVSSRQKWAAVSAALYTARRRLATAAVGALALWLSYHVVFGPNGMLVYQQKRSEYNKLEKDIKVMREENDRFTQQIKALKSDPEAIEREAREQLRYARPGEVIYVLPQDSQPGQPSTSTAHK
jgi:cell division protein FtsB